MTSARRMRCLIACLCLGVASGMASVDGVPHAAADPQLWTSSAARVLDEPALQLDASFEARLDSGLLGNGLYLAGLGARRKISSDIETALTVRYLGRARPGERFAHTYRLELELDPRLPVGERTGVYLRNRLELAVRAGEFAGVRVRHRLRVVHALRAGAVLDRLFFGYELYYSEAISRQEIVPTGVRFRLSPQLTLTVLYLVRLEGPGVESVDHVVSSLLSFTP